MAKKEKPEKKLDDTLWSGIGEADFADGSKIEDVNMEEYNLEKWGIFSANVNYFRQLIKLSDSLKPIERRILYTAYLIGANPSKQVKSMVLLGETMKLSAHGDGSIYQSMVNMAQTWKRSVPLLTGIGNFGNAVDSDMYASPRYTEIKMSKYAYECFFSDYDPDCVETIINTGAGKMEPITLPAKFPNILVNGGIGLAPGNAFLIPPFNINDIVDMTKKLIKNPNYSKVYMVPDFPSNCLIVDDGHSIRDMCETGKATIRVRAQIDIVDEGKQWSLRIKSLPWLASLPTIAEKLTELTKKGLLPIKDIEPMSQPYRGPNKNVLMRLDHRIIIDKSQDPYAVRAKLYKMTKLEDHLSVNFKAVTDDLHVGMFSLRDLILSWIDERRSYKRRLYNKRLGKISARISLLKILIHLLTGENLEKTIKIIRTNNYDQIISKLMQMADMTSYQAGKIADMRLSAFTKDARAKYIAEKTELEKEQDMVLKTITSETRIDEIILDEIDDLKKYASDRKSEVVTMENHQVVSSTDHVLIVTKQGYAKKLPYRKDRPDTLTNMGSFRDLDYPTKRLIVNNMDNLLFFDSYGRFTNLRVHDIDNTEPSNPGSRIYDLTKLNGEIVTVMPEFGPILQSIMKENLGKKVYLVTLTKNGFIKKTDINEYIELKNTKNVRAMKVRDDDQLIYAGLLVDGVKMMIYTKNGYYTMLNLDQCSEQSKDSMGVIGIRLKDMDQCAGLNVVGEKDKFIVIVTAKGMVKKCETEFFGDSGRRGSASSYLATLDKGDSVIYVNGMRKKSLLRVCTRTDYFTYDIDQIDILPRRGKCKKLIPVPLGSNIITVDVVTPSKK